MSNSFGQDTLKATFRNCLTELNVNLFQGQLSLNNALNQVKFRYMYSPSAALRIGFIVNSKKVVNASDQVYGTYPTKSNETGTSSMIGINFGLEKHFSGTKRLSPYIGGEITVGYKWSKYVDESTSNTNTGTNTITTTTNGAWPESQTVQLSNGSNYIYSAYTGERGFVSYGLNFITGFDFYMAKHLFIGYEVEFGFTNKKYSTVDVTSIQTNASTNNSNSDPYPNIDNKEFSFGPSIINGIRIGYVF